MITFNQIQECNEAMPTIDFKGKGYVMVNERVKAFRKLFPEGFIRTDLLSLENGIAVMQAKAGYYEDGQERILGTGLAYEKETGSYINKTSYIENCETSAVGRALGFIGFGIDGGGIASAEELANALNNQKKEKADIPNNPAGEPFIPPKKTASATTATASKIPAKAENPVKKFIKDELATMGEAFGIPDKDQMLMRFMAMRESLIKGGVIEDVPSDQQTMEQAKAMIDAMYKNFRPSGESA